MLPPRAVAGRQALHRLAGAEEAAGHVGREYPVQARRVDVFQARLRFQHAGVVHQHVEAAETFVDGGEQPLDIAFLGYVAHRQGFAALALDALAQRFGGLAVAQIVEDDRIAAFGGEQSGGGADAAAGSGDQHDVAHDDAPQVSSE